MTYYDMCDTGKYRRGTLVRYIFVISFNVLHVFILFNHYHNWEAKTNQLHYLKKQRQNMLFKVLHYCVSFVNEKIFLQLLLKLFDEFISLTLFLTLEIKLKRHR